MNPVALLRNAYKTSRICPTVGDGLRRMGWLYGSNPYIGRLLDEELAINFSLPAPVGRLDLTVRNNDGSDAFIFSEVFEHRYYDLPLTSVPTTVLDLGANAGYSTIFFGRRYPKAALACVEPVPKNLRVLEKNLASNRVGARVFAAAVSVTDGTLRMDVSEKDYGHKVVGAGDAVSNAIDVKALSMDTILKELGWERIGLLNIDIEGYEKELLRDRCDWLTRVDAIAIECHPGFGKEDLEAVAAKWGFGAPRELPGIWLVER